MVRLLAVRAAIEALKRVIAISDKLKPKTWVYLAITQAVMAALCFWGYWQLPKDKVGPAEQITIQVDSSEEQIRHEKLILQNRIVALEIGIAQYRQNTEEARLSMDAERVGRVASGRTGKAGVGPAYREAKEKLQRNQQLLADAEEQLKRDEQLFIALGYVTSKAPVGPLAKNKGIFIGAPVDTLVFDPVYLKGFSKAEEAMIRKALLAKFTSRSTEVFQSAELQNPRQVAWQSGVVIQHSRDLYRKQVTDLGPSYTKTSCNYRSEFSTARAQAGELPPVITNIGTVLPRATNNAFGGSLYGRNFNPELSMVIVSAHSPPYYSTYNHLWSRPPVSIGMSRHTLGVHTHFIMRPDGSAVQDMRLSTSMLKEVEAIMSVIPWEREIPALDLVASDTTDLKGRLSQYRTVHFATHGFIDRDHKNLSTILLSMVNKGGSLESRFLQLPFQQFPRFEPRAVLQVTGGEGKSILDTLVKLMLLFQAIVFTTGSAISSVFVWLGYRRGKLDLRLKELQVREAEIRVENMERDRARAVQEASQSNIVLLS